jgi:DNA polymerase-3 subunit chi
MNQTAVHFMIVKNKNGPLMIHALADYIETLLEANETLILQCNDENTAHQWDQDLWTFDPVRFIPHVLYDPNAPINTPTNTPNSPVQIHSGPLPEATHASYLINLSDDIPDKIDIFSHVVEWVIPELQIKKREHYRWYQQHHYPLTHKEI